MLNSSTNLVTPFVLQISKIKFSKVVWIFDKLLVNGLVTKFTSNRVHWIDGL
jgi:hypothetical protein